MQKLKQYLQILLSFRHFLAYQLFVYFGLAFLVVLTIAFNISKLDDREFTALNETEISFFNTESKHVQKVYDLDDIFEQDLSIRTPGGSSVILVEKNSGSVSGMDQDNLKPLLAFLYRAEESSIPLARSFDHLRINGPFIVKTPKREYNEYFIQTVNPQKEGFNEIFDSPWLMSVIVMCVAFPILFFLSWRITRPVKELRLAANAIALGDLKTNPKIEKQGIKELRDVGRSFNQMVTALQDLNQYQQRLLADISHELKTPLARLQLAVAIIRRRNGESSEIDRIENEIQKLNTMILDLLSLSRQQVNSHLARAKFPVQQIWFDILEDAKFEMNENGLALEIHNHIPPSERYYINGNCQLLSSAVENVIRNAKKYAETRVSVVLTIHKKNLVIDIEDDGPGVPESEYEQIFRPFYRVDEARARQTGGTGLGLAIVLNAVQQHKGTVVASKASIGGLRVEIVLPLWID
ncbi:envelope stress sensor histidine kinase CpxA [Haemophilus sputorum]